MSLSGSFSQATATPTEVGFYYGTASDPSSGKVVNTTSSSFSLNLTGLKANTKYYYCAYVKVAGTGSYASQQKVIRGPQKTFTTLAEIVSEPVDPALDKGWLELPAAAQTQADNYVVKSYYAGSSRNYTHLYDKDTYASLWTAYPLYKSTTGGSRHESWAANPNIPTGDQINTWNGSYGVNYESTIYARGHQIPDADRSNNSTMQAQTYYATNLVPQIQDKFNGGIWMNLESAIRDEIPSATDTLYVVTGVTFKTVGGSETVRYIQPKNDSKTCPVPNYFWKVVLKAKRSGGVVTSAKAVGFWFEHKQYSGKYTSYAVSVDQIEQLTGFDFFVNLPDSVEGAAESNSSWISFQDF